MEPHQLLSKVLSEIEENKFSRFGLDQLSESVSLSSAHLHRIFKFAFNLPLAGYIRSRKLSAVIDKVLSTDFNIIDIALECGFEYEQSFIRAFKREFGITPGNLRNSGSIVKVTPPLQIFDYNKMSGGVLFGPDIVMVPEFYLVGKQYVIPFTDSVELAPKVAKHFWHTDRGRIKNAVHKHIYYGLTNIPQGNNGWSYYLPSVKVTDLNQIPKGLTGDTFKTSLCARFHYIGEHHYYDISSDVAKGMYDAITEFIYCGDSKYHFMNEKLYFEKIDTHAYDGTYCLMEWFTPIY